MCSFWLCESIVANPIICRLVPRPSRFETRQWSPSGEVPHPLSGRNASDHWYLTLRHRIRGICLDPSVSLVFNLSFLLRSRCKSVQRSIAMWLTNGKQASKLLISQIKALIFSRSIAKWSTTRLPLVRSVSDYSATRLAESSVVAWYFPVSRGSFFSWCSLPSANTRKKASARRECDVCSIVCSFSPCTRAKLFIWGFQTLAYNDAFLLS